jgi:hypothetical protein
LTDAPWTAPGPARFLQAVCDELDAGIAVLVELPITVDEFDLEIAVAGRFELRQLERIVAERDTSPLATLTRALELDDDRSPRSINELLRDGRLTDSVLWVSGLQGLDSNDLAGWLQAADELTLGAEDLGMFMPLVLCVHGGCAEYRLPDTPRLRLRRWWDVLGRLDLAVLVQLDAPDLDPILREEMIEFAGGDYPLARQLAVSEAGLDDRISICQARAEELHISGFVLGNLPSQCTPANAREAWLSGAVGVVDAATVVHVGILAAQGRERELARRRWASQIRALLPQMDLMRVALLDLAIQRGAIAGWRSGDAERELEFADIARALRKRGDLAKPSELAAWLRDARNELAHLRPVDLTVVDSGRHLAARAGIRWA